MKLKKKQEAENSERWLLTYSDLITLLMIFFVVMYASSSVSTTKYAALAQSLNSVLAGGSNIVGSDGSTTSTDIIPSEGTPELTEEQKLDNLKTTVDSVLAQSGVGSSVNTTIEERGLVITFSDSVFFESGQASIRPELKGTIDKLAVSLKAMDNTVRVEGHTDNVPINTSQFSSNWQLSAVRAANVVQYLIEVDHFSPTKISANGYGEYKNIAPNDTEAGRSKNRRIDIVIINSNAKASAVS